MFIDQIRWVIIGVFLLALLALALPSSIVSPKYCSSQELLACKQEDRCGCQKRSTRVTGLLNTLAEKLSIVDILERAK